MPIAINTDDANEQHYEVPTPYFLHCLGKHLKYSSCLYETGDESLDEAEEDMLRLCAERAEIKPGMSVLELGCGWGSFSLYLAAKYPKTQFTCVSNSSTQRQFITKCIQERRLSNLTVLTDNVVTFTPPNPGTYDRVVSVEMFEHMKNYQLLLARISSWMAPGGKLFLHFFSHKDFAYHYTDDGPDDWMTRYFFAGGTMPSHDLMLHFQDDLVVERSWRINGIHYSRTLEEWLRRQDAHRKEGMQLFRETYPPGEAQKWFAYWRLFYIACSELFKYDNGEEWGVTHVVMAKR